MARQVAADSDWALRREKMVIDGDYEGANHYYKRTNDGSYDHTYVRREKTRLQLQNRKRTLW